MQRAMASQVVRVQGEVDFEALTGFLRRRMGREALAPFGIQKEAGLLTVVGGRYVGFDVLPADRASWEAAEVLSPERMRFPCVSGRFRLVDHDTGATLEFVISLRGFEARGMARRSVAAALGLKQSTSAVA